MKKINNYRIISPMLCLYNKNINIAIRSFDYEETHYFLLVNIENLNTKLAKVQDCYISKDNKGRFFEFKDFARSRYYKILNQQNTIENNNNYNQGLKRINKSEGVFISIDIYSSEMKLPDLNGLEIIIYSVSHFIFYIVPLILKKPQYLFSKLSSTFKKSVISNVFIHNFP